MRESIAKEEPIDVIFMDQVMPNMNGLDATKLIRQMGYGSVIIAVTGNVLEEDRSSILLAGTDDIIEKPLKVLHMQKVIASE